MFFFPVLLLALFVATYLVTSHNRVRMALMNVAILFDFALILNDITFIAAIAGQALLAFAVGIFFSIGVQTVLKRKTQPQL